MSLREGPPDSDAWLIANEFSTFLKSFYDVILHVYCSSNATFHTTLNELLKTYGLLLETGRELLSGMTKSVQEKHKKFWGKLELVILCMFI